MQTSFKNINIESYLESKRARADERELLSGKKFVNERQEVVQRFVDKINKERKAEGGKFPPVTWTHINGQLRDFKYMSDLKRFYKECDGGKCFSSLFWWKLKQMRSPQLKA